MSDDIKINDDAIISEYSFDCEVFENELQIQISGKDDVKIYPHKQDGSIDIHIYSETENIMKVAEHIIKQCKEILEKGKKE